MPESITNSDILGLLKNYPFKPYQYMMHFGGTNAQVDQYLEEEVVRLVGKGAKEVRLESEGKIGGYGLYRESDFDTEILGLKTAKIDLAVSVKGSHEQLINKVVHNLKVDGIEYATFRLSSAEDLDMIHALETNGFKLVDGYLILLKEGLSSDRIGGSGIKIRDANEGDIAPLQDAIAPTFLYSRFFRDRSTLSEKSAVEMHREWIKNSILGKVAEHVIVAEDQGEPIGFMTLEMDSDVEKYFGIKMGHIPLVGIDPKYRGRHIALDLSDHAFKTWFTERGAEMIRIETQLINIPATRTYENAGFRLTSTALTYRWANTQ